MCILGNRKILGRREFVSCVMVYNCEIVYSFENFDVYVYLGFRVMIAKNKEVFRRRVLLEMVVYVLVFL